MANPGAMTEKAFAELLTKVSGTAGAARIEAGLAKSAAKESGMLGKTLGLGGVGAIGGLLGSALGGKGSESAPAGGTGMMAEAARSGTKVGGAAGGGSLPSLRNAVRPSVSASLSTNKLLTVAINYLSSIDNSLKNQIDFQRFDYTQNQQAQKELSFEQKVSPRSEMMSSIGQGVEKAGKSLFGVLSKLAIAAALANSGSIIKSIIGDPGKALAIGGNLAGLALGAKPAMNAAKTLMSGAKPLEKELASEGLKIAGKTIAKDAIISFAKKIPFVSVAIGMAMAYLRAKDGDLIGAGMELVSGFLPMLGPGGIVAAFGMDAALAGRDIYRATRPTPQSSASGVTAKPRTGSKYSAPQALKGVKDDKPFMAEIDRVSKKYNINANDLLGVMSVESGFRPDIKNPIKGQTATGLIQFTEGTAKSLGTTTAALRKMTRAEQMKYVDKYLEKSGLPQGATAGELYSRIFLPGAASRGDVLVSKASSPNIYNMNAGLDINKNGIIDKADLQAKVEQRQRVLGIAALNPPVKKSAAAASGGNVTVVQNQGGNAQQASNRGVPNPVNTDTSNDWMKYNLGSAVSSVY